MRPLASAEVGTFHGVRAVLIDIDEILTAHGRLDARTYQAVEHLRSAGIAVICVTTASAGWCDQLVRVWPVDGVIGESGAFYFRYADGGGVLRDFWLNDSDRDRIIRQLAILKQDILIDAPDAQIDDDYAFRLYSLAFARPVDDLERRKLMSAIWRHGGTASVNKLRVIGSLGGFDNLKMASRVLHRNFGIGKRDHKQSVAYVGDPAGDLSMFEFFEQSIGIGASLCLNEISRTPFWITSSPGERGFTEVSNTILRDQGDEIRMRPSSPRSS